MAVPIIREGKPMGVIGCGRREVRPFTAAQMELVTTFADQAVIAIENVRLFDEVQARTAELSESLEQQTATSEVLSVISSSPAELEPGLRGHAGECDAALRRQVRHAEPARWRRISQRRAPQRTASIWPNLGFASRSDLILSGYGGESPVTDRCYPVTGNR
jgi:K+-sensing histidine kinase KdpD